MNNFPIFILFILIGCSSKPEPVPEWVLHTKNNPEIWKSVGIGLTREIAIKQATNSIASQISVQIESNMKSIKVERNMDIEEFSRSIIESHVNISLPEVIIEEVFQLENTWYARASLNKKEYYKILEDKRKNAQESALRILDQSTNRSIVEELKSLFKAYEEIKNYLDIPFTVILNNGHNVNLYSEITSRFRKAVQNINIIPEQNSLIIKSILPVRKKIRFNILSKNEKSTSGLPFIVIFESGLTNTNLISKNNSISVILEKAIPGTPSDLLTVKLDIESLLNTIDLPKSFQFMHSNSITIEIVPLNIFIQTNESNLGEPLNPLQLNPIITQHFIDNYSGNILDNQNDCDLNVSATATTKKGNDGSNDWGIFKSFADLHFTVLSCDSSQELFQYSLNQIQGGDFNSHKNAGSQAIKNLSTQLNKEIFPLMDKSFFLN